MTIREESIAELALRDAYAALAELRRRAVDMDEDPDLRLMAQVQLRLFETGTARALRR